MHLKKKHSSQDIFAGEECFVYLFYINKTEELQIYIELNINNIIDKTFSNTLKYDYAFAYASCDAESSV